MGSVRDVYDGVSEVHVPYLAANGSDCLGVCCCGTSDGNVTCNLDALQVVASLVSAMQKMSPPSGRPECLAKGLQQVQRGVQTIAWKLSTVCEDHICTIRADCAGEKSIDFRFLSQVPSESSCHTLRSSIWPCVLHSGRWSQTVFDSLHDCIAYCML